MKNFQPGGLRNRREDIGGRPQRDVNNYAPKTRRDDFKPGFKKPFDGGRSNFNPKDRAPRETKMYAATCSDCGRACEVPFRPDGVKPVLCRDCYSKKSSATTNMTGNSDRFTENEKRGHTPHQNVATNSYPAGVAKADYDLLLKQLAAMETKVSQILDLVKASEVLMKNLPTLKAQKPVVAVDPVPDFVSKSDTAPAVKKAAKKVATKKVPAKKEPVRAAKKAATKKVAKKATK